MLLIHQAGSVKVGEVVRYTLTYTPSADRILPSPTELHVRIRNTSAIPLRAAYLHGPYTLHVSAYPSTFNPNKKLENIRKYGVPEYEPNLKAGGNWTATLKVPEDIRESGDRTRHHDGKQAGTVTWIIEIASQILFSNTASVHYELLIGRDERSLDVGFAAIAGKGHGEPGQIHDFQQRTPADTAPRPELPKGVYSRAVHLVVEDTTALWDKPALPKWAGEETNAIGQRDVPVRKKKQKKIHLVVLTHGLHSNVGADMLYLKESIDAAAKQARADSHARKAKTKKHGDKHERSGAQPKEKDTENKDRQEPVAPANVAGGQEELDISEEEEDEDDEQVLVRGFSGNAVRTERGIQYLGKRLAKFVLTMTYPTQPYLPTSKSTTRKLTGSLGKSSDVKSHYGAPGAAGTVPAETSDPDELPFTVSSISFIGHSLGGLIQTYAIAYIHKHSPDFFTKIQPVNFIAMASPLLGLSNENPLYVKFALDFGLVGRTGQDLGLTWRAPNIVRSGWSTVISGFGGGKNDDKQPDPRAKPLLRILPTGPAHQVLKMFRNRTVYSNVVNDGIVPLRTSCLLFLDWRGLDKVENARRENGLITTMATFGWAELTGANTNSHRPNTARLQDDVDTPQDSGDEKSRDRGQQSQVPQPSENATQEDNGADVQDQTEPEPHQFLSQHDTDDESTPTLPPRPDSKQSNGGFHPINDILNIFRPKSPKTPPEKKPKVSKKYSRTIQRAQTLKHDEDMHGSNEKSHAHRPAASRGDSLEKDPYKVPPPKTSVFEAAGDLISPPLPPESWLIDPSKRARTIFHDRIYHPEDIPPPPTRRPRFGRSFSSNESLRNSPQSHSGSSNDSLADASGMKVEEKIARAYHRDLSWRKVLVRLEPDAHNNMVVRRMFANAYGWDVIKHLCDTHFSDNAATARPDDEESGHDRAKPAHEPVGEHGQQVNEDDNDDGRGNEGRNQDKKHDLKQRPEIYRTTSEKREASDSLAALEPQAHRIEHLASHPSNSSANATRRGSLLREDSALWSDSVFDDTEGDSDDEAAGHGRSDAGAEFPANPLEAFRRYWNGTAGEDKQEREREGQAPAPMQPPPRSPRRPGAIRGLSVQTSPSQSQRASGSSEQRRSQPPSITPPRPVVAESFVQSPVSTFSATTLGPLPPTYAIDPETSEPLRTPTRLTDESPQAVSSPPGSSSGASTASALGLSLQKPPQARLGGAASPPGSPLRRDEVPNGGGGGAGVGSRRRGESTTERVARLAGSGEGGK